MFSQEIRQWPVSQHPDSFALLVIVLTMSVLCITSAVQRANFIQPNVLVTAAPWVLLPAVLVPPCSSRMWRHWCSC